MQASDLKRLKETEAELSQYTKMYAELARENYALDFVIITEYNEAAKRDALVKKAGYQTFSYHE